MTGLPGDGATVQKKVVDRLGFDSVTGYQWVHDAHHEDLDALAEAGIARWAEQEQQLGVPVFPHVSIGWDNSPRYQGRPPRIVQGQSPAKFAEHLRRAKQFLDERPNQVPLVTINSWNEWTECSYLQPDTEHGDASLEAVKRVFAGGGAAARRRCGRPGWRADPRAARGRRQRADVKRGEAHFNPAEMAIELDRMIEEAGVRPFLHARFVAPVVDAPGRVTHAIIEDKTGRRAIAADMFIDASGDADLAHRAQMDCYKQPRLQPPTACVILQGMSGGSTSRPRGSGTPMRCAINGKQCCVV